MPVHTYVGSVATKSEVFVPLKKRNDV